MERIMSIYAENYRTYWESNIRSAEKMIERGRSVIACIDFRESGQMALFEREPAPVIQLPTPVVRGDLTA